MPEEELQKTMYIMVLWCVLFQCFGLSGLSHFCAGEGGRWDRSPHCTAVGQCVVSSSELSFTKVVVYT